MNRIARPPDFVSGRRFKMAKSKCQMQRRPLQFGVNAPSPSGLLQRHQRYRFQWVRYEPQKRDSGRGIGCTSNQVGTKPPRREYRRVPRDNRLRTPHRAARIRRRDCPLKHIASPGQLGVGSTFTKFQNHGRKRGHSSAPHLNFLIVSRLRVKGSAIELAGKFYCRSHFGGVINSPVLEHFRCPSPQVTLLQRKSCALELRNVLRQRSRRADMADLDKSCLIRHFPGPVVSHVCKLGVFECLLRQIFLRGGTIAMLLKLKGEIVFERQNGCTRAVAEFWTQKIRKHERAKLLPPYGPRVRCLDRLSVRPIRLFREAHQKKTRRRKVLPHTVMVGGPKSLCSNERKCGLRDLSYFHGKQHRNAEDGDALIAFDNLLDEFIYWPHTFKLGETPGFQGHEAALKSCGCAHSPVPKILSVAAPEFLLAPGKLDNKRKGCAWPRAFTYVAMQLAPCGH